MAYLVETIALIVIISTLLWVLVFRSLPSATPYLPISKKTFPFIKQSLNLNSESVFYDLGCGDGKVVDYISRAYPNVKCVGIEKSWLPYWLAKFRNRNNLNVIIGRRNFFLEDLSAATHIYLYLFPVLMPKLLEKFKTELKFGTVVLSCDFTFPNIAPIESIKTGKPPGFGGTIYKYIF